MLTRSIYISIILLGILLPAAHGQRTVKVSAWVEVQTTDGRTVITCWCQNDNSTPVSLIYKAVCFANDTTLCEGKTLALPGQPNLLLNAGFLVPEGQFDRVHVQVFRNDEIVASAEAVGPPRAVPPALPKAITDSTLREGGPAPKDGDLSRSPTSDRLSADDIEIEGLVLDETRSKLAHDFYEQFYANWTAVEEDINTAYAIIIREMPNLIGIGTRIIVEVDGQELTALNLHPRSDMVEALALQVTEAIYSHYTNPEATVQEIATDDISGTGVY
jgi:hypothetical protein